VRIYEINTRVHCSQFGQINETELAWLADLGFDAIWLMGVWQISPGALKISKLVAHDFEGSPYAVPDYRFSKSLGGKTAFDQLVQRAHKAGLKVIVDFVSNHLALDSPWIDEHPEFFITSNLKARRQSTSDYFLHSSGNVVAFGRDPYFPPWHDTSQLDYTNPELRKAMIDVLKRISRHADGVRCDMAMLVLRDYIRTQWYPLLDQAEFDRRLPGEFWDEAISRVRKSNPDFKFIAEAYWDKEGQLIDLGFDLAYEKKLYDALVARNAEEVIRRISRTPEALRTSLYFIENHDEPRAGSLFDRSDNLTAAALILSLPGSVLIHEGQMEGLTEKLPVQRIKPLVRQSPDEKLREGYTQLLTITRDRIFREGALAILENGTYGVVSFARLEPARAVVYAGQISMGWHKFNSLTLDLTLIAEAVGAAEWISVSDLITGQTQVVARQAKEFHLNLRSIGVGDDVAFCLLEVRPGSSANRR
jgi:glycosidase